MFSCSRLFFPCTSQNKQHSIWWHKCQALIFLVLNSWIQSKDLTFTQVHFQKPSTCVHTRESVWFGSTWGNHWRASSRDFRCCKHSLSRWVRVSSSSESDPRSCLQYFNDCSGLITSMFAIITVATIKPTIMAFIQLNRQHWIRRSVA